MKSLAYAVLGVMGATAVAQANVEVGGIAGFHIFREEDRLGQGKDPMTPAKQGNSALFAFRLGVFFNNALGVEAEGGLIPTEGVTEDVRFDTTNITVRGHLAYQFRSENPTNIMIPFFTVGGGLFRVVDSKNNDFIKKDDSAWAVYGGVGLKYRAGHNWGLRFDARLLIVPGSTKSVTQDFEGLFSIYREWGRPKKAEKLVEPPKEDQDPDKDGILGANDKCPKDPEDKDSFQDDDGCPDLDNDGDGIPDTADKCATEPEDKDGFQDDDGCPDPDNDGDGVPDAADKCPIEPETKNGFQDDDGCADEIPEKLKQFTGVIQGITFKTGAADLAPASFKALDKAVAVLAEFKDIKLEIQGHTDDVQIKSKTYADNNALSQARAESVKAYFVSKGIDEGRLIAKGYGDSQPVEAPAGLKGGKLTAARAKNRRVEFKLVAAEAAAAETPAPPAPGPEAPKE
jgi:OOP family OmpA-OmpF porin